MEVMSEALGSPDGEEKVESGLNHGAPNAKLSEHLSFHEFAMYSGRYMMVKC